MVNLAGYQAHQDVDKFPVIQSYLQALDDTRKSCLVLDDE